MNYLKICLTGVWVFLCVLYDMFLAVYSTLTRIRSSYYSARFSSLAWSKMTVQSANFPSGIIAGGMADGTLNVWDAERIINNDGTDPLLVSAEGHHTGSVRGLQFNPHRGWEHSLASGGSDGDVLVMSLERPETPQTYTTSDTQKHQGEVTKVAWNTGTHYILASSDNRGSTCVWDMKQRKLWCEIKDPSGGAISDIAWGPDGGTNIITASGDDRNPVLKYWDLRSSTSLPLATLKGHKEGILSVGWCPSDPYLLMSCGKDNRTIIWDLLHLQSVYEFPTETSSMPSMDMAAGAGLFSGIGMGHSGNQKRYQATWSPHLPAVAATCSFDRRVQFHSLTGFKSSLGRAPKWLRKPVGAAFGFGGKLVTFGNKPATGATAGASGVKPNGKVHLLQVVEDPALIARCEAFHKQTAIGTPAAYKELCDTLAGNAITKQDKEVWGLMKVICFEANAREQLQTHLGFDSASIAAAAEKYVTDMGGKAPLPVAPLDPVGGPGDGDFFGSTPPPVSPVPASHGNGIDVNAPGMQAIISDLTKSAVEGLKAEPMIRQAVVVGNFQAAVDCCMQAGLMAEALLLAQCGDQALWLKTQSRFFEMHKSRHPFLGVLHAIIKTELMDYVVNSNLAQWRETLAVIGTYGKSDEFPGMCEALAARLETAQNANAAVLCYMCATNVARTVAFWTAELDASNAMLGRLDSAALQRFVEKVTVFVYANPTPGMQLNEQAAKYFAAYADLLASQGKLNEAPKYLQYSTASDPVLIDRLYHGGNKPAGSKPPPFPFTKVVVNYCAPVLSEKEKAKQAAAAAATAQSAAAASSFAQQVGSAGRSDVTSMLGSAAVKNVTPVSTTVAPSPNQLPVGWVEAFDPNSGCAYYVNQTTGVSQWERPAVPVAAPTPAAKVATPAAAAQPNLRPVGHVVSPATSQISPQAASVAANNKSFAGQSHIPAAGAQPAAAFYPAQSQTSNIVKPAIVTAALAQPAPAPAAAVAPVDSTAVAALGAIIDGLSATATPVEKRQLAMIATNHKTLVEKAEANQVSAEVMGKVGALVQAIQVRDFTAATAIQADLANTAWAQHGSWIKGIKMLLPIISKH